MSVDIYAKLVKIEKFLKECEKKLENASEIAYKECGDYDLGDLIGKATDDVISALYECKDLKEMFKKELDQK